MRLKNLVLTALISTSIYADNSNITTLTDVKQALHFLILDYYELKDNNEKSEQEFNKKIHNVNSVYKNLNSKISRVEKRELTTLKKIDKLDKAINSNLMDSLKIKKQLVNELNKNSNNSTASQKNISLKKEDYNELAYDKVINQYLLEKIVK